MSRERLLFIATIVLVVLRFAYLNWINWDTGELTTGQPGVQWWLDSPRYWLGAKALIAGEPFEGRTPHYLSYIVLVALALKTSMESLMVFQLFLALFSAYVLYDLSKHISGNRWAGIVAAGIFLSNPFIVTWHLYLLTESTYMSMLIICCWAMYRSYRYPIAKWYALTFVLVLVTALLRPNGWLLFPVWTCFIVVRHVPTMQWRLMGVAGAILGFLFLAAFNPFANSNIQIGQPVKTLLAGEVVFNHPEMRLKMPATATENADQNWVAALSYITSHPIACFQLAFMRAFTMLIHVKHYRTLKYNLRILIWLIPAYTLALIGVWRKFRHRAARIIIWVILIHILSVSLTYAEHESRFLIHILPLFYVFSGCGFVYLLQFLPAKLSAPFH